MSMQTTRRSEPDLTFSSKELFDLAVAWIVLSVAFALLFEPIHRVAGVTVARS